ncbi:hypothetical protein ACIBU0_33370 [Streptomyces sp. NPDC049627]|uniref:hypothetical protein n=1 Tax=Streptomyces sp. NPDC049627 TaxID=3365595 RepID=UPI003797F94E
MSQQPSRRARWIDAAETACVLVGIPLGIVSLVQRVAGHEQGWAFRRQCGRPQDPWACVIPLLVLAVLVAAIAVLEPAKKWTSS